MKKAIVVISIILLAASAAKAQFIFSGKIEYERKVNVHAQLEEMEENEWMQKMKSQIPKFNSIFFDMSFDNPRTYYHPGKETDTQFKMFGGGPATENIVYTDIPAGKVKSQKTVYEQKFLVDDSVRKLQWKEKEEIRSIAGHQCNKAVS